MREFALDFAVQAPEFDLGVSDGSRGIAGATGPTGPAGAQGLQGEPGSMHRNLLDNWYFADPINQRGQTKYGESAQYTIDRWRKTASTGSYVALADGGVEINNEDGGGQLYFMQKFEKGLPAGDYTLSALVSGVVNEGGRVLMYISDSEGSTVGGGAKYITGTGRFGISVSGAEAGKIARVQVQIPVGCAVTLEALKLEKGAVSTLEGDPPPSRALELAKCQRYQISLFSGSGARIAGMGLANSATAATVLIPVPVTLRATPTVTFSDMYLRNYALGLAAEVTAITAYVNGTNCAWLQVTSSGLTAGEPVFLRTEAGNLLLDANL